MSGFTVSACTNKGLVSDGDELSCFMPRRCLVFSVYSLL